MQKISAGKFHFEPPFTSLDHLVGAGEEAIGHREAKRLRGLERLIVSSYLVGACTGRPAGFSPLRMRDALLARPGFAFGD
jgi:hypothetical protein